MLVDPGIGIPQGTRNPPHPIDIPQSDSLPTIFMIANVYDPATPMANSVNLHNEIGKHRSVLSTRVAAGHMVSILIHGIVLLA